MNRPRTSSCVLASLVLALTACHSAPRPAIDVIEHFDVRYSARLDGTPFAPSPAANSATTQSGEPLTLRGEWFTMPHGVADRLLRQGRLAPATGIGLGCARVPALALHSAIDDLEAARVASSLATHTLPSTLGSSTVVDQVSEYSYIAAFDVSATSHSFLGSPVIDVAHEGYTLEVRPERDGEHFALDIEVRAAEILRPLPTASDTVIARTPALSIQVPVLFHQRVATRASLRANEAVCLVLPASPSRDEVRMIVLECAPPQRPSDAAVAQR